MDAGSLIGKTLKAIWIFPSDPVHSAWVSELTTLIVTSQAFLEFSDGALLQVDACEVERDPREYPALGLELHATSRTALRRPRSDGTLIEALPFKQGLALLPAPISSVEVSDPLEEGAISQLDVVLGQGGRIIFRHILPPLTLGIEVHVGGVASSPLS